LAQAAAERKQQALEQEQLLTQASIRLADLEATKSSQRKGIRDWRNCRVGAGAAGEIFQAYCKGHVQQKVAIKRVHERYSTAGAEELTDEMKLFTLLRHDHIVRCFGILEAGTARAAIVTELCDQALDTYLDCDAGWDGKTQAQIDTHKVAILRHVALGLQFLHCGVALPILHKDLKPENILLERGHHDDMRRQWKICDFGEARVMQRGPQSVLDCSDDHHISAATASPELHDGPGVGLPTDIYAFGMVMWAVLTRVQLWHWLSGQGSRHRIAGIVGLDMKRPRVPDGNPEWAAMIRTCLHHNPHRRPSATELSDWLQAKAEEHGAGAAFTPAKSTRRGLKDQLLYRVVSVDRSIRKLDAGAVYSTKIPGLLGCDPLPLMPVAGCSFGMVVDTNTDELTIQLAQTQGNANNNTDPEPSSQPTPRGDTELVEAQEEAELLKAVFDDIDEDRNGTLSKDEVRKLLQRLDVSWSAYHEQQLGAEWCNMCGDTGQGDNAEHGGASAAAAFGHAASEVTFGQFHRWWHRTGQPPPSDNTHDIISPPVSPPPILPRLLFGDGTVTPSDTVDNNNNNSSSNSNNNDDNRSSRSQQQQQQQQPDSLQIPPSPGLPPPSSAPRLGLVRQPACSC
jgi:serine/threonine protein kinase